MTLERWRSSIVDVAATPKQHLLRCVHRCRVRIVVALRRWRVILHLLLLQKLLVLELLDTLLLVHELHVVLAAHGVFIGGENG